MTAIEQVKRRESKLLPWTGKLEEVPWWALILLLLGLLTLYAILETEDYLDAFLFLLEGIKLTILITLSAFAISVVLGLVTAFGRVSKNPVVYTLASLYVEVIRGVPILVQIFYVAFVLTPIVVQLVNGLGNFLLQQYASFQLLAQLGTTLAGWSIRDVNMEVRAIIGLALAYGAFEAEVYRAGIQSIERGQMEAARSLGMTYFQSMRYIILPQAIRRVLPPLGNDFIALLKDSSLVSSLAVRELTQLAKLNRARTFLTYPTWNTVSFLYLTMTILLSLLVQLIEKKTAVEGVERGGERAAFDTRLAANLLDALFIGAASLVCLWIAGWVGAALFVLAFATIGLVYFLAFWSISGQTPGKQIMGIKIVPAEDSTMGLGRAVLRLVTLIVSAPVGAIIGLVFPALSMVLALAILYVSRLVLALDGAVGHFLSSRLLTLVLIIFGIRLLLAIVGVFGPSKVSGWRVMVWIVNIGLILTLILGFFLTSSLVASMSGFLSFVGWLGPIAAAGLGFWWLAWDAKRQGWHDKLARTYVVKT